jgi:hypothetical protein
MRVFVRRKSGPLSTAVVVLALLVVLAIWIWATKQAPAAELNALRVRCTHLPVLIGLQSSGESPSSARREATYLCLPDYLRRGLQFRIISNGDAPVQVVVSRTWDPLLFAGVLALMGAFLLYARRSKRAQPAG